MRFKVQGRHEDGTLFRLDERGPKGSPVIKPQRRLLLWLERLPLERQYRSLSRMQDRGSFRGQGLPPPSRG